MGNSGLGGCSLIYFMFYVKEDKICDMECSGKRVGVVGFFVGFVCLVLVIGEIVCYLLK